MRILVTGGSGRIGRQVLKELAAAKHELLSADRNFMPPGEPRICRTVITDFADAGQAYDVMAQFRPEVLCHLAANPNPVNFSRQEIFVTNVRCCYNALQAAGDLGVRRVVNASSIMAAGYASSGIVPASLPMDEDVQIPPTIAYAMSKRVSETICDSMAARYPSMSIVSLRPTHVMMPDAYGELQRRRSLAPAAGGEQLWSYIDVRDVATAFRAAAEGVSDGHRVFQIAAKDHALDISLSQAISTHLKANPTFPEGWDQSLSPMDCSRMTKAFGWRPSFSWREQNIV